MTPQGPIHAQPVVRGTARLTGMRHDDPTGPKAAEAVHAPASRPWRAIGAAALSLSLFPALAGGAVGGIRHIDVKDMGDGGRGSIPGVLIKHPYMHGGFERQRLDQRILDEISSVVGEAKEPRTELSAVLERYGSDKVQAGRWMGMPEKARRAAWIAGAWEQGLREVARHRRERKEYEQVTGTETMREEADRRTHMMSLELRKRGVVSDTPVLDDPQRDPKIPEEWDDGHMMLGPAVRSEDNDQGVTFLRYSKGLYYNLTGDVWFDTRPPRREGKPRYPSPEPHDVWENMNRL